LRAADAAASGAPASPGGVASFLPPRRRPSAQRISATPSTPATPSAPAAPDTGRQARPFHRTTPASVTATASRAPPAQNAVTGAGAAASGVHWPPRRSPSDRPCATPGTIDPSAASTDARPTSGSALHAVPSWWNTRRPSAHTSRADGPRATLRSPATPPATRRHAPSSQRKISPPRPTSVGVGPPAAPTRTTSAPARDAAETRARTSARNAANRMPSWYVMLGSGKRRLMVGAAAVLVLVTAIPVYMVVRSQTEGVRLARMLRNEMTERWGCPVPAPFVEPSAVVLDCWDGKLPGGRPFVLIFGTEPGSRAQVANYIGIWLPPGPDLTDDWLLRWKQRVADRGDWWAQRAGVPAPRRTHLFVGPPE